VSQPPPFLFHPAPAEGSPEFEQMRIAQEAAEAFSQREQDEQIEQRRTMIHWAPVICSCRPWPELHSVRDPSPPQAGCLIHGNIMVTLDGEVL
jgi:hypothetical protein